MSIKAYIKRGLSYVLHGVPVNYMTAEISYLAPAERLKGKKIIITGGSRGIGYAMAKKFISEGASVLISGRDEHVLRKISEELNCLYLKQDIQSVNELENFISDADSMLNGVDCLVNNAGVSLHEGNIRNVSIPQFDSQFNTNLKGPYFLTKYFISLLEKRGCKLGNVLFVSSERGVFVDDLPYGLTKSAINSLVKGLAYMFIKDCIRVNAIAPGVTASEMTGFKSDGNLYVDWNMHNRIYLPEEVAEVACFLLSDASRCISGQVIECNEGKCVNFKR